MQGIGWLLIILGIGSFVLNYLEREFILLMWVDNWGPDVGLAIRIGMIVLGAILVAAGYLMGGDKSEASSDQ